MADEEIREPLPSEAIAPPAAAIASSATGLEEPLKNISLSPFDDAAAVNSAPHEDPAQHVPIAAPQISVEAPAQDSSPTNAKDALPAAVPLHHRSQSQGGPAKTYSLKEIQWKLPGTTDAPKTLKVIMQNENGPCPLYLPHNLHNLVPDIFVGNVLLLRGDIKISNDHSVVTYQHLVDLIGDVLISKTNVDAPSPLKRSPSDAMILVNMAQNLQDVMNVIPTLQSGLDVNVKFDSPFSFELTPALLVFDLFGITLCHGWTVDPQDAETHRVVVGSLGNYNRVVEASIYADDVGDLGNVETPKKEKIIHEGAL
ncbi:Ubiquitin carboxyl-terminal hydrolase MINDY-1 [Irineochytrium annulatum]|nr:Ubiquitin carboxyl-terminal hydrolase MINDY-1 [Irineochytrium annulatum]